MRCKICNGIVPSVQSEITRETRTYSKCRGIKTGKRTRKTRIRVGGRIGKEEYTS